MMYHRQALVSLRVVSLRFKCAADDPEHTKGYCSLVLS